MLPINRQRPEMLPEDAAELLLNRTLLANIHDADIMTAHWTYYVYVLLMLLPTYLFFKMWMWMGWELYVNN